ncbi:MAG: CHAT domain-containing protein, partial [Gemmatimonadales bacterium]
YYLARSYLPRGGMDSAIAVLGRAAEASERGRDRFALALTLYIRGHLHTINSDYGLARADQFRALALARASGNGYALARASLNLSRIALLFGDYTAALRYAAETDSVLQHRTDPFIAVTLADVLGNIARARGDPAAAREAYQRALSQSVRLGPPWPAFQRRYLAALARDAGDWAGARRELDAARRDALAANMGAWDAELEYDFGVLALLEGNLDQARRSFQRFLETLPPEDQARRYLAGMRLAVVALKQGRVDEAETRARAAAEAFDDWRASLGDRELRALVFELREGDLDLTSASAAVVAGLARAGRVPSAFALAERRRARDLLDRLVELQALGRTAAVPGGTPGAGAWGAAAADTIAASLPDDHTALLEFIAGERGTPTTLFVLTRTRLTAFELPSIDRLGPELARFSALVESGQDAPALGRRLGRILLDSAMAVLGGGIDRLLIIPDGPLHRIDFELLRPGDRLLLESHEVSVVPSGAVLVQLRRRPRNERPLEVLAVGDPDLPERTADSAGAGVAAYLTAFADAGGLERLPASGREARFAASLAPRSVVLLRAGASEARFKRESLARYRLIHLATHAVVDEASLARTALALAPGDGEDGFLGPGELADLHFDADLIVLSGCRTAGGVIVRGEGILGLTATLLAAGGRSVLATRWAVGDRAVAAFLQRFYRAMARGATAGGALREARLAARASGVPATDWAAFELVGDPGIRLPLREPRPPWWLWAGGGVVALVLWMVIRRARRPARAGAGPAREAAA